MKQLIIITSIILSINAIAQIPIPNLCAVSVDTTSGKPLLYWSISDTSSIDGFIIKRIIYDGTGVVDGTLNNIAVLKTDTLTWFLDTSNAYNTQAQPQVRPEKYVVVAYDTSSGQISYSGFSQMLSTILLTAKYDSCKNIIRLQWTTNQNIDQYTVFVSYQGQTKIVANTTDTSLIYIPEDNGDYTFLLRAHLAEQCHIDSIFSNKANVSVHYYQRPLLLYIHSLASNHQDTIEIKLHINLRNPPAHIVLYRDNQAIANFDNDFDATINDLTRTDTVHTYILRAYSSCGQIIDSSNIARNIIISGSAINQGNIRTNSLHWQKYNYWAGTTLNYTIFASSDGIHFSEIAQTTDTSYDHNLNELILTDFLPPTLYYYAVAQEINDTLVWHGAQATTNIIKITQEPILHLPNAINPLSPNPEDREFTVYADFMENYNLTIFDRYGRVIFTSHNPNHSWNGYLPNGQIAPVDSYFYQLEYTSNGKKHKVHGSISVIY